MVMMDLQGQLIRLPVDEAQSLIVGHLHEEAESHRHKDPGRVVAGEEEQNQLEPEPEPEPDQ